MKRKVAWISCFEYSVMSSIWHLLIGKLKYKGKLDS
jgi:hypothetical protein